jgi:hypothetical protein
MGVNVFAIRGSVVDGRHERPPADRIRPTAAAGTTVEQF